ncbi:hypothetical protein Mal64_28460 [Pseudobythopirellula maris]|uniref:Uncharacterized protein n=1 Tax=Pseudobythopirellula maris TaxID=2527991 RepID=A0A5C5ZJE7_9BACT|nr:hypothetical protein Mal64_28460 [Pseudobythopirellula maris]
MAVTWLRWPEGGWSAENFSAHIPLITLALQGLLCVAVLGGGVDLTGQCGFASAAHADAQHEFASWCGWRLLDLSLLGALLLAFGGMEWMQQYCDIEWHDCLMGNRWRIF